jgi:hypothetical protein
LEHTYCTGDVVSVRAPVDAFEQFARGGLEWQGLSADDTDIEVMRFIDQVFGPELRALMAMEMNGLWAETDFDPSRAPTS